MECPLEPNRAAMAKLGTLVLDHVVDFVAGIADHPASMGRDADAAAGLVKGFLEPPPEHPGELSALLDRLDVAASCALETAGPGYLAFVPGGGVYSAALAAFYGNAVNRYGGLAFAAPAMAAIEESVIQWMARDVCLLPEGSGGLLTTGGSMAALSAVVAARHRLLGEEISDGSVYVTPHTHHSIAKTARLAGIRARNVREVACTPDLRMDVESLADAIRDDRLAGLRPFLVVGSAGTTSTGTVDPLPELADLAEREGIWFHVDGAYGGFFQLTERGRERLTGVERADSVVLDPHKTLFAPFGTGALVVRDPASLYAAHEGGGSHRYLRDVEASHGLPNYAHLGPELTHDIRGLRAWLPLHLHGVAAFRDALDEKLDLTQYAYERLIANPALDVPWRPDLSTVAFRCRDGDKETLRLLVRINDSQRVFLSRTAIDDRQVIRMCIVSHRTHQDRIEEALDIIDNATSQRPALSERQRRRSTAPQGR